MNSSADGCALGVVVLDELHGRHGAGLRLGAVAEALEAGGAAGPGGAHAGGGSMLTHLRPSGTGNSPGGTSSSACSMNAFQIGAATLPPVSFSPIGRLLSKPTHTPASSCGV